MKYYRLNFSIGESEGFIPSDTLIEVTKSYTPAEEPQFALKDVEEFEAQYAAKKKAEEDKSGKSEKDNSDDNTEDPKNEDPENKDPEEEKTTILENKEVFKQNKVNKTLNKINTNEIHFIKTIII